MIYMNHQTKLTQCNAIVYLRTEVKEQREYIIEQVGHCQKYANHSHITIKKIFQYIAVP